MSRKSSVEAIRSEILIEMARVKYLSRRLFVLKKQVESNKLDRISKEIREVYLKLGVKKEAGK